MMRKIQLPDVVIRKISYFLDDDGREKIYFNVIFKNYCYIQHPLIVKNAGMSNNLVLQLGGLTRGRQYWRQNWGPTFKI